MTAVLGRKIGLIRTETGPLTTRSASNRLVCSQPLVSSHAGRMTRWYYRHHARWSSRAPLITLVGIGSIIRNPQVNRHATAMPMSAPTITSLGKNKPL